MSKHVKSIIAGLVAAQAVTATAGDATGAWMKILPAGTFTLRDGRGPFTSGDNASMQAIVDRTLRQAGATELMVDYDHQAFFGAQPGIGGTAKAAGWIKELQVRDDGIWARVEWTGSAAAAIRANEYRYLSPLFGSDKAGKVTVIANVGLVNMPAMDLAAVAARFETSTGDNMDKIAKALGLAEGVSEDAILAAVNGLATGQEKLLTAAGLKKDAKVDDAVTAIAAMADDRSRIAEAVGLKKEATGEDILVAAKAAVSAGENGRPDPSKFVPIEQMKSVQDDLKALTDKVHGDDAERAVDQAIEDGRLIPAQRDWGLELAKSNRKAFDDYVGTAPVLTAAQRQATAKTPAEPSLDQTDMTIAAQLGLSKDEMTAARKLEAE